MVSAVFLDRDGVVNRNIREGYVTSPDILQILPGVPAAIHRLNDAGIPVLLISNQQGVGKGLMTQQDLDQVDSAMRAQLYDLAGAVIDRSYYCVHLGRDGCDCRKPKGGQIRKAAAEFEIDLSTAVFVGDTPTDMQAAADAGVGSRALVMSGGTRTHIPGCWPVDPHSVHTDLDAAIAWILSTNEGEKNNNR